MSKFLHSEIVTCYYVFLEQIIIMKSIEIPEHSGVILLKHAVTFPHGLLPLHIFEPRYRKMLEDAFATNSMICVANLTSAETPDPADCTLKVGYIGVIRASEKMQDGRSDLILHSVSRIEFLDWESDTSHPYPRAQIRPISDIIRPATDDTELLIKSLRYAASSFLAQFSGKVIAEAEKILDSVNEDLPILTDVVAQQFVNDEDTRQYLIEENDPIKRAERLIRHLRTR